jgi:hypothetical protein
VGFQQGLQTQPEETPPMKILVEAIPELLGALGSTGIISAITWCVGRRRARRQAAVQAEQ